VKCSNCQIEAPSDVSRDAPEPWVGYEVTQCYLGDLRARIEAVTKAPVHYSWFLRMDPQIRRAVRQRDVGRHSILNFLGTLWLHGQELLSRDSR